MHHDLDTRDIVAYTPAEINTHFRFLRKSPCRCYNDVFFLGDSLFDHLIDFSTDLWYNQENDIGF